MEPDNETIERLQLHTISELRMDALIKELTKRVMVVNDDALTHLLDRGVIASAARDGCCKPDGGTCCPNKRLRIDVGIGGNPGVLER
jgi:hypothetical protein